jgi:hypothetical protein
MEQWEKSYYITAIAGSTNGSSLVVMSKGLNFTFLIIAHTCILTLHFVTIFPVAVQNPNVSLVCPMQFPF